jgi:ADP-dependent NAD(P)H-hydrate dehydratase
MSAAERLEAAWLRAHPLPAIRGEGGKEERGRVLIVGGSRTVPGALLMTADAALRVGAGKVQIGTVASVATPLGLGMPEAAVLAMPEDDAGEIAGTEPLGERLAACDALVFGPAMARREQTPALVAELLERAPSEAALLLDAAALTCCTADALRKRATPAVLTPHRGELASLLDVDMADIAAHSERFARETAERFGAVVVLKSRTTVVAAPGEAMLTYTSEAAGLGTAGSGDVLAGVIGGLLARGTPPRVAAAWGVWLHGECGRLAARTIGPLGFRASELPVLLPALLASAT